MSDGDGTRVQKALEVTSTTMGIMGTDSMRLQFDTSYYLSK